MEGEEVDELEEVEVSSKAQDRRGGKPQHLLDSLRVNDFKSVRSLDVKLGQVNVLVGANGSGKSNVLEAIGLLGAAASGRIDDQALLRRGVRPGVAALYKSAFRGETISVNIHLGATSDAGAKYDAWITNPIRVPQPYWIFKNENLTDPELKVASRSPKGARLLGRSVKLESMASVAALARAQIDSPASARELLRNLDDFAIFAPVTPVLRGIAPDSAPRSPVGLFGGQLPEAVAMLRAGSGKETRRKLLEEGLRFIEWAKGFDVAEPSTRFISPSVPTMRQVLLFRDRYMVARRNELSGYDASEGALYVLFMLVLALHDQSPRILAVDNFDQALNPGAARELARLFVDTVLERGRQVFLTTHNPPVLDGLPLDDPRVRLFTVHRDGKGHTAVKHVEVRDLKEAKSKFGGDAVSRLWAMGRLGGIAHVDRS